MRKEIQQESRNQKPGAETFMGVFPDVETGHKPCASGYDSKTEDDDGKTAGSAGSTAVVVEKIRPVAGFIRSFRLTWIAIGAIKLYQWTISPLLPRCCRFTPSCSHYAVEAFQLHGIFKGSVLTAWRLLRCQPFCKGGFDPVPPRRTDRKKNEGI